MGKLNPIQVKSLTAPGRYMDGDGLMLEVKPSGSKSWVVRLQAGGKRRDYGLGSFKDIGLSEARDLARDYRKKLRLGLDPLPRGAPLAGRPPLLRRPGPCTKSTSAGGATASMALSGSPH
ncbi:Arm DNA-binding domain-containing protein [Sphingomonas telluris]|uniref:Arm DNA-binding domain-containing protein n=1 Tax=Sphingomonas telluris TaxID=2907998 RepID=UPI00344CAE26